MPTAICLIEKLQKQRPVERGSEYWESGNWKVAEKTAKSLVGARIYFHETKSKRSYYGGVITDFRVTPGEQADTPGRVSFIFVPDREGVGFVAGPIGWKREQKTIP
jgi:hypothetical protein